jgi:hypothetical protein
MMTGVRNKLGNVRRAHFGLIILRAAAPKIILKEKQSFHFPQTFLALVLVVM